MTSEAFHLKYRPIEFKGVVGQDATVRALRKSLENKDTMAHSFLFVGPSGVGKTTIARILARELGCTQYPDLVEGDAATNNGIDSMRNLLSTLQYKSFSDNGRRVLILDEAHALSKAAWQSLLKIIEEPPPSVFFIFCTTEENRVPKTIKTRCHTFPLESVKNRELEQYLESVAEKEDLEIDQKWITKIVRTSYGSVRQALVYLDQVKDLKSKEQFESILSTTFSDAEVIDLARLFSTRKRPSWNELNKKLNLLKDKNPESLRIVVYNYISLCILNSRSEKEAFKFYRTLESFSEPYEGNSYFGSFVLSVCDSFFGE